MKINKSRDIFLDFYLIGFSLLLNLLESKLLTISLKSFSILFFGVIGFGIFSIALCNSVSRFSKVKLLIAFDNL